MRTFAVVLLGILVVGWTGVAMSRPPADGVITLDGRLNYPYLSSSGGRMFLQLSVSARDFILPERRPLNLCVVLDRSGSMADERKIDYAKKALVALIDQLNSKDILSVVIYDDVVEVLCDAQHVRNKSRLKRQIQGIEPRGSTNLGGGMIEGFRQVEYRLDREYVNRVVLLSDGLANQGITDPGELNRIARNYRSRSIALTTMGVGLEYNENLMVGLSESGGGNYYFIESPRNLASIIRNELNALSCVVATNATIELTLGRNVRLVNVIGCEHRMESEHHVIQLGDLYASDDREITVELEVPEGAGSAVVAEGSLRYDKGESRATKGPMFSARVQYTRDVSTIEKHHDWDVQAKGEVATSTESVERAMKALDEGRREDAAKEIAVAKQALSASPAAVNASGAGQSALRDQADRLGSYEEMVSGPADARQAKKSIQYRNYKTQKNKD